MENDPQKTIAISPNVRCGDQWQEALADPDLLARFNELVDLTQASVDKTEFPWVNDRQDVAMRWQHAIEMLGGSAASHSHPLFSEGRGWVDEARVAEVLEPVDYRSFDASFIENALILTHSLAVQQKQTDNPGLSVNLNTLNNRADNQSPEFIEHFTNVFDLRDMAEPTETIIGEMTLEDFRAMSEEERKRLMDQLFEIAYQTKSHGRGYGWSHPPQEKRYVDEYNQLIEYSKLIEYGTADTSEIEQILDERKTDEIARLRQERPDFGKIPDDYAALDENIRQLIGAIFMYFDEMRERYEKVRIDTYSLRNMDFGNDDLNALKEAGVLIDEETTLMPDGYVWSYSLSQPYYECWVSRHFPT